VLCGRGGVNRGQPIPDLNPDSLARRGMMVSCFYDTTRCSLKMRFAEYFPDKLAVHDGYTVTILSGYPSLGTEKAGRAICGLGVPDLLPWVVNSVNFCPIASGDGTPRELRGRSCSSSTCRARAAVDKRRGFFGGG